MPGACDQFLTNLLLQRPNSLRHGRGCEIVTARRLGKGADRPIVAEGDRARVVAALGCVDGVVLFDEDTPAELIAMLLPDVLVKGGDYLADAVAGADVVQAHGGRVVIVPLLPDRSTTRLLERLRASS